MIEQKVENNTNPESTRKAWIIVFVVLLAGISVIMNQYKVPTMIGAFMQDFKMFGELGKVNWLMSVFAVAGIVLALPTASLINRFGAKIMGLVGLACSIIGITIGALAYSYAQLFIGRIIEGAGVAMMGVVATTLIAMYFPREKAGAPMGIWNLWYPTGSTLGYTLAHPVVNAFGGSGSGANFGWHSWWLFGDIAVLIAFILFALIVSNPNSADEKSASGGHGMGGSSKNIISDGLKVGRMWLLGLSSMFLLFCSLSFLTQVPHFLASMYPEVWPNDAAAGAMSSLGFGAAIPMSFISAYLLKKFTSMRSRANMIIICAVASYLYAFAYFVPISPDPANPQIPLMSMLIVCGCITGYVASVMWANVSITMPRRATIPVGMAIVSICQGIANLSASPIIGYAVQTGEHTYNWGAAAVPIAISATIGLILSIFYKKTKAPVYDENKGTAMDQKPANV